jgi:GT2 family glycosyltransferase
MFLPVDDLDRPGNLSLHLNRGQSPVVDKVTVCIGGTKVAELDAGKKWRTHIIPVPSDLANREGFDLINNAASFLKADGAAGDRGIYEPDRGQYDAGEDVSALCGCSMLISRDALNRVGLFDRDFFMYFEDTELSWRLRKSGYRLRYQPMSVVRHIHAATSKEWSSTFNFFVGRNRVLMLIKHGAPANAMRAYINELLICTRLLAVHRFPINDETRARLRIQGSLLKQAPRALLKRAGLLPH